jgi:hypothetical protein
MRLRTWHYFDRATGIFTGQQFSTSVEDGAELSVAANCPDGCGSIEGIYDTEAQRVDMASGLVIDYQPPQPTLDHEWNVLAKRWRLTPAKQLARDASVTAQGRIEALERGALRTLREVALGKPGATARLQAIDDQIAALRVDLVPGP